jgi:hypothetical protein
VRQEEDARYKRADPKNREDHGQRQVNAPSVRQSREKHKWHDTGGRNREAKVDIQRAPEFRILVEISEYVRINQPRDNFQPDNCKIRENEKAQVNPPVQPIITPR